MTTRHHHSNVITMTTGQWGLTSERGILKIGESSTGMEGRREVGDTNPSVGEVSDGVLLRPSYTWLVSSNGRP